MKKLLLVSFVFLAVYIAWDEQGTTRTTAEPASDTPSAFQSDNSKWRSGQQVQGQGQVERVLADDTQGSRHQRFIVRMNNGQTLLIAHNIDLAPRIVGLRTGDSVTFNGEYEWNDKGGVIHWTHQDPQDRHAHGWIRHNGRIYQ